MTPTDGDLERAKVCALQPYALSCNDPNPKAIWCFPCKARKALENFHKLLSETKGDNGK